MRLSGYDYAEAGAYFITTNTRHRLPILGGLRNDGVHLTPAGRIVLSVWRGLPKHYSHVTLDEFVVMPDHIHGILFLDPPPLAAVGLGSVGAGLDMPPLAAAGLRPAAPEGNSDEGRSLPGLPEIVRALKSFSARAINQTRNTPGAAVWQRGYHERVIRSDEELARIREYIITNSIGATLRAETEFRRTRKQPRPQ